MNIAYFTTLNPVRTGISDWAEELLPYLQQYMEIDIYVDNIKPDNKTIRDKFSIFDIKEYDLNRANKPYDLAIFQAGNSSMHNGIMDAFMKYGGVLELHDISMHHYLAARTIAKGKWDDYKRIMIACHGRKGEKKVQDYRDHISNAPWHTESLTYTVTKEFIDRAQAVIVHSDFAMQMVKGVALQKTVLKIPLHTQIDNGEIEVYKHECRELIGIRKDILVFGSFGLVTPYKRIIPILYALHRFKSISNQEFKFFIVGENRIPELDQIIPKLDLEKNIVITGRVNIDEFQRFMGACDIAFNLRYPTQGESSASLHRLLGYGKIVLVTAIGSFMEYPDEFVRKIRYGIYEEFDILKCICELVHEKHEWVKISANAIDYSTLYFDIESNAEKYYKAFQMILGKINHEDYIEELVDNIDFFRVKLRDLFE